MLANLPIHPTVPASNLARARKFYAEKLGLTPSQELPGGLIYECGGSWFLLYPSGGAGTAQHTVMGWTANDIEKAVAALRARGVVFEDYDMQGLKTVNGIADMGASRAAWFKDSEGNLLGIVQLD